MHPATAPVRRHWAATLLKFLLIALCAVTALYLIAANAFLALGGVSKALASGNDINATLRRAWTFWPGEVYVRDLRLTFQDKNLQWSLDLPRGKVCLRLFELPSRVFHATCVRGEGAVFRMRHRVQPEVAERPHVTALPPIREFAAPAVFEATVPPPPSRDEDLWTIHLEGVDVGVSEVWAQQLRYLGQGRARGAFRLHAGNSLWVKPASLELAPGRLLAGNTPVAQRFSGRVDCRVDYFDIDAPQGREVLRDISTELRLHGRDVHLDAMTLFIDPKARVRVGSGAGTLEIAVKVHNGVVDPASVIAIENERVLLERPPFAVRLDHAALQLTAGPDERGEVVVTALSASLERQARPGAGVTSGPLSLTLEESGLDTTARWSLLHGELEAPELEVPDLSWFAGDLPAAIEPKRGSLRASLLARFAAKDLRADLAGNLQRVELALGAGKKRSSAAFSQAKLGAQLELSKGRRRLSFMLGPERAQFRGPAPERGFRADVDRMRLSGDLGSQGSEVRASLELAAGSARTRLGKSPISLDLDAKLVTTLDLERREARGSGRVRIRNGTLRGGSFAAAGWWADVALGSAEISMQPGLKARATFNAKLRDGTPVLSLLEEMDKLPRWLSRALPLNEIEATGELLHRCHVTDLRVPQASAGPLEARGRLLGTKAATQGAFLLRLQALNPIAVGLSVGMDDDNVSPLAGEDWLGEHLTSLQVGLTPAERCE